MLHPARAVVNGLDAAFLAKAGMTGPEHILEAEDGGLLAAMSDTGDIAKVSKGLGTDWEILHMDMKILYVVLKLRLQAVFLHITR